MRLFLIFSLTFFAGCSPREPVFVEREIPPALTTPCAEPVKGPPSEGAFAELAHGWRHTAICNADKLQRIASLTTSSNDERTRNARD